MKKASIGIIVLLALGAAVAGLIFFTSMKKSSSQSAVLAPGDSGTTTLDAGTPQQKMELTQTDEEELRNMIKQTMLVFAAAQKSGDFKDFYNLYSSVFRAQFTMKQLREIYSANIGTDYSFVTQWPLTLDPAPTIDKSGVLTVIGAFESESGILNFTFMYVREGTIWMLLGVKLKGEDKEPSVKQ